VIAMTNISILERGSVRAPSILGALGLATLACVGLACGGDERPPDPKAAPAGAEDGTPAPLPTPPEPADGGTTAAALDEGDWGAFEEEGSAGAATEGPAEGGDATGGEAPAAAAVRHPGPCSVSWSGAARLRFTWNDEATGGSVRIDGDRDGKSDVCATFTSADGRTTNVKVDDGCDKKFEGEFVPTYEEGTNLATAVYTDDKDGTKTKRDLTLVALPSFVGVAPGYPLWAAKADVKLKSKKGLVSSATVKTPTEGPPVAVTFTYDADGRISRVKEDFEADGSVDRQFDYKYDDAGNVTRVTLKMVPEGGGSLKTRSTASLDYKCWAKPEPAAPEPAAPEPAAG
jgi:hypothetical protein